MHSKQELHNQKKRKHGSQFSYIPIHEKMDAVTFPVTFPFNITDVVSGKIRNFAA